MLEQIPETIVQSPPLEVFGFGWMKPEVLIRHWCTSCFEWETGLYDLLRSLPIFLWFCEMYLKRPVSSQHLLIPPSYLSWNWSYSNTDHMLPIQTSQCRVNAFKQRTVTSSDCCVLLDFSDNLFFARCCGDFTSVRMYNCFLLAADLLV